VVLAAGLLLSLLQQQRRPFLLRRAGQPRARGTSWVALTSPRSSVALLVLLLLPVQVLQRRSPLQPPLLPMAPLPVAVGAV
jgi:hypothetical protein